MEEYFVITGASDKKVTGKSKVSRYIYDQVRVGQEIIVEYQPSTVHTDKITIVR